MYVGWYLFPVFLFILFLLDRNLTITYSVFCFLILFFSQKIKQNFCEQAKGLINVCEHSGRVTKNSRENAFKTGKAMDVHAEYGTEPYKGPNGDGKIDVSGHRGLFPGNNVQFDHDGGWGIYGTEPYNGDGKINVSGHRDIKCCLNTVDLTYNNESGKLINSRNGEIRVNNGWLKLAYLLHSESFKLETWKQMSMWDMFAQKHLFTKNVNVAYPCIVDHVIAGKNVTKAQGINSPLGTSLVPTITHNNFLESEFFIYNEEEEEEDEEVDSDEEMN